jgi:hypothetical protein
VGPEGPKSLVHHSAYVGRIKAGLSIVSSSVPMKKEDMDTGTIVVSASEMTIQCPSLGCLQGLNVKCNHSTSMVLASS